MTQKFTCPVNQRHLSQEEAWKNYDKPIDDLLLYIPSRSTTPQEAPRISKFLQLQWSSVEREGEGTRFAHPGSEMHGTSKDGAEESMKKKLAREDDGRSMVCVRTQVPSDNDDDEEDRSGGDDSESVGKRSRLEADYNNDSSPCHNLASIRDELEVHGNNTEENTMIDDGSKASNCHEDAADETEQRNEETNESGSQADENILIPSDENDFSSLSPQESMQTCDDELDVHGSNADENTMTNDVSKEPDCLLHEDGVIAGDDGNETLTPGGDGISFVHPDAEIGEISKDEMNIAEEAMNKKRDREDGESSMVCVQVPSDYDDTEEADRLTNAQRLKRRFNKKYIYVRRSRGDASKRSGLEADDNNDSGTCYDLASKSNEIVPLPEIEQRNENGDETGSNTGKTLVISLSDRNNFSSPPLDIALSPPETMQTCDDELDVHGSTADDNTTINDDSMEPDYLLHEPDGVIAGDDGDKMETNESGSQADEINVLITSAENNFSSYVGFAGAIGIAVSPQESMQTCDDELNVHGSNAGRNTIIDDGSKAPVCLLNEDGAIAGDETELRVEENNEGGSKEAEITIPIPSDENNSLDPLLASEGASEDKRSKAHKSMGLSSSDKSNTHVNVGDQNHGQDCLPQDNGLGSEETMKSSEQLEDLGKSNDEGGIGNDSVKQSLLNIEEMAKDIEERIMKAQKRVAWLKARKAMRQRNVTSARLGR
ncbi:hypothetical protein Bca52824_033604 [Brassica carinata]|uniref:Uncharacterized protein n=1 Tax=Brassica carinata TaxID=52824 RepID=A0A8X7SF09_BRACI|nr:hypothetical protein Bca52824_033604 [Brassica carinata]